MWQQRLEHVLFVSRTAFKWGWIPLILYLGKSEKEIYAASDLALSLAGIRRGATDPGVPPPSLFQ